MSLGLAFWILMLIWIIFGFTLYRWRTDPRAGNYGFYGHGLLIFVLLFLLGWQVFGFILHP